MVQLRRTLLFVFLFSFCLTACVLPVSAGVLDEYSCVINLQPETFGIIEDPFGDSRYGFSSVPATFDYTYSEGLNIYTWEWSKATAVTYIEELQTDANKVIEFIVNVGDGEGELTVELDHAQFDFMFLGYEGITQHNFYFGLLGYAELVSDTGEVVYAFPRNRYDTFPVFDNLTFTCSQFFSVVYHTTGFHTVGIGADMTAYDQAIYSELELLVDGESVSLDSISIQIEDLNSTVTDIGNDVGSIKTTVENIQDGVVEINGSVTDMKEQLEEPDSPIWSAAGEKISDTLTDLFVPDPEQLSDVKQGFDDLAKDKLGGAYTAMETVDDTVKDVSNKLHNPNSDVAVEFPGISVPLGGEVGTVVLAERQFVTLPTQITAILHPVSGTIFTFICGLGTLNVLKDMVECFLSGYSYAEYLHRNKGGSDE